MIGLGVNIDHVATVRQARRGHEPDPVWAAVEAQLGGADGITVHLREDRRHIQDHDLSRLIEVVSVRLNLEMAATDEMVAIACRTRPHLAMLVPEGRTEITTEGGLDVSTQENRIREVVGRLRDAGMTVSAFIDPFPPQIESAGRCGFQVCEVHTGAYAHAANQGAGAAEELERVRQAGRLITEAGMQFNAGHGLNYLNVQPVAALPDLRELHIGHSIVSRSIFVGLRSAVAEMKRLMTEAART